MPEAKKPEKPEVQPKKKVAAKLFDDVKRPEDTPASATAKPVIVGHTNTITDPMVALPDRDKASETPSEMVAEKPKRETVIQPIQKEEKTEIAEEKQQAQAEEEAPVTDDSQNAQETSEEATPETSQTGVVDAIVGNINTKKERSEAEEKQQIIDNEINELITSKKYNVKIRSAPNKRKARLISVLLIALILGGGFWYFGMGPGKDLWLKEPNVSKTVGSQAVTTEQTNNQPTNTVSTPSTLAFTNSQINTTFSYPNDWKVEVIKDAENKDFDVITLTSPSEEIDSITENAPPAKVEAFLRARIVVENTEQPTKYASELTQLTNCVSEDIVVGTSNLKLLLTDAKPSSQNVSMVSLGLENCEADGNLFKANDQVQLSTKQNTYVIYAEHILSNQYLEKNGIKEESAIASAQESGITTTKDAFKASKNYLKFVELLKTLKEL